VLDTITSWQYSAALAWNVSKTRSGLAPVVNSETLQRRLTFTLGDAAGAINQLISTIVTVAPAGSATVDLSGVLTNVVNEVNATLSKVRFFRAVLLSAADLDGDGNALGNAASAVVLGGAPGTWPFLVDISDKVRLDNGDEFTLTRRGATGLPVTAGTADTLNIANQDAGLEAKVLLVFAGGA
jgi:hypothetical protein